MDQALTQFRTRLEKEEATLKQTRGPVAWSDNGPVSLGLVKALAAVVEAQAKEIAELKQRIR